MARSRPPEAGAAPSDVDADEPRVPSPMSPNKTPGPDVKPAAPLPPLPPLPTMPYASAASTPAVLSGARTWMQDSPWLLPVGGALLAFALGLTIGLVINRRPTP